MQLTILLSDETGASGGAVLVGQPEVVAMAAGDELFWSMDISSRYNAKEIAGEALAADSLPKPDAPFKVNGIPFVIGKSVMN